MKDSIAFDSIEEMKAHVADERNRFNRFVGNGKTFAAEDVKIVKNYGQDRWTGWKNSCDIVLNGQTVGHCGE